MDRRKRVTTQGMIRGADGRLVKQGYLTDAQRIFAKAYVTTGGNARAAAIEAGYSPEGARAAASRLLDNDRVAAQIHQERVRMIQAKGATLGAGTMLELVTDDSTPSNVRYQAARYLMECAGHGPQNAKENNNIEDKPLSEMTVEELETFISAGREAVEGKRNAIDGQVVRVNSAPDSEPQDSGGGLTD